MPEIKRAIPIAQLYEQKRKIYRFSGEWWDHIGSPEAIGSWFVYGHSGNGKTSYCTQMARYLANFGTVWYNGLEEGTSLSFKRALQRVGMESVGNRFLIIEDQYQELRERLRRRNRADFVFIDSLQLFEMNLKEYTQLKKENPSVVFIIIGHAEGKKPEGRRGKRIEYLSFVKIWIEGFKAFPKSRYGSEEPFIIYPKRASEYWSDLK